MTVSVSDGTLGGGAATVPVNVTCEKGFEVLAAHLGLSQDDQTINGMAGLTRVEHKSKPVTVSATVTPFENAFHAGSAYALPFVLVIDPKADEAQAEEPLRRSGCSRRVDAHQRCRSTRRSASPQTGRVDLGCGDGDRRFSYDERPVR